MAWLWPGDRPLSKPMMVSLLTHVSRSLDELTRLIDHHNDAVMDAIASQNTSLTIVYSTVYLGTDQTKHQNSASLAIVRGIHRDRWIPRTNGQ